MINKQNLCKINELTPFFTKFVLRVRVTNKTNVRNYSNVKGEGKVFSFDVCDQTGEIRISAFNAEVDRFYDLLKKDKIYYIYQGTVKNANKNFNRLNNEYEISLGQGSIIELCDNFVDIEVPKVRFDFITLSLLNAQNAKTLVDAIGVIRTVSQPEPAVIKKSSKETLKRSITIVDQSLTEVEVTLWGEVAENFTGEPGQVLAIKGALVNDFRGKNLSAGATSIIQIDPDIPETPLLQNWYRSQGSNANFTSLTRTQSEGSSTALICHVNHPAALKGSTSSYYTIAGTIMKTNRTSNHFYKSCRYTECTRKKVTEDNDGLYHCGKCNRTSPTFEWCLMLSVQLADSTGSCWVTAFQDSAETILGKDMKELVQLFQRDEAKYSQLVETIYYKTVTLRVSVRAEEYNNEQRLRVNAARAYPFDRVKHNKRLFNIIDALK